MQRKKLKIRILKILGLALVLTSVFSTIVAYYYFNSVVKNQVIRDEEVKLNQMAYQLEFMINDIQNFSKSIAIDPIIQEKMVKIDYESEFQKTKISYEVASKLVFYKSLRNYIGVITLRSDHGGNYSSISFADERYYREKFNLPELKEYEESTSAIFSKPFFAFEKEISQDVISYKTSIRNINQTEQIIGDLYLDIHLEYFLRQIRSYASNYENVFLMEDQNNFIYMKDDLSTVFDDTIMKNHLTSSNITRIKTGYMISQPISNGGWTLGTYISNDYIRKKSNFVLRFFIMFFLISIIILLLISSRILDNMIRPISQLTTVMENIQYDTLEVDLDIHTNDEIELLTIRFKEMLSQINQYMKEMIKNEQRHKEMEFDILLSQINPHYLYNVLNTVVYLSTASKNKEVVEVVNAMIVTLQETLKVGEMHIFTTLESELNLVKSYVKIQSYRYPNTFEVEIKCDESLYPAIVPKTIIQPILENALFHGIIPSEEAGKIFINISVLDDLLKIIIEDTGVGVDNDKIEALFSNNEIKEIESSDSRKHIGIRNVQDRIQYLYGNAYGLNIQKKGDKGTIVSIVFPFE